MTAGKKILMIAGEASGDLHGAGLIKALLQQNAALEIFGIGGDRMKAAGMTLHYHVSDVAFMGFTEVIKHLGDIKKVFDHLVEVARRQSPDLVVLIDYPGFNLRLGKKLKSLGFPIFYYIAPQVWAWHVSRAKRMAAFVDRMAVIFPFEVEFFAAYGIDARFVGHPLLDGLKIEHSKDEFCRRTGLSPTQPILALFPGSRKQEIEKLLPILMQTVDRLVERHPNLQIAVSRAETIEQSLVEPFLQNRQIRLVHGYNYELMAYATAAIVKSGTSTLETACFETPFCIIYKVSPMSYFIGRQVVQIPFIGLVNIVAKEEIAREFIQERANPEALAPEIERCLFDESYRQRMIASLTKIRGLLGGSGAAVRTAQMILEMIE
jgi:lipid-A-disaccharide synthase